MTGLLIFLGIILCTLGILAALLIEEGGISKPILDRWVAAKIAQRADTPEVMEVRTSFGNAANIFLFESETQVVAALSAPDERSRLSRHMLSLEVLTYGGTQLYFYNEILCDARRLPYIMYVNGVKID